MPDGKTIMKNDPQQSLKTIKELISNKDFGAAFSGLRQIARPEHNFSLQYRYASILASIPEEALPLKPLKIALLASSTVEHFSSIFRFWMAMEGFAVKVYSPEFDTVNQTIIDPQSELYSFQPDLVWIFSNYRDVISGIPVGCSDDDLNKWVKSAVSSFTGLWEILGQRLSCYIIQNNADMPATRVFGNFDGAVPWGRQNALRAFNCELSLYAGNGVTIFDMDFLSANYGKSAWFDDRYWYHSKHAFAMDANGIVAFHAARLIGAMKGGAKKCLVLDLDNTLWGGVIGDDGLEGIRIGVGADGEAFVDFQKYILSLKNRGVILAVCSKNEEDNAKLPFLHHADMQLKLNDIAVFMANWDNKADNIREIARILNIGLDSIVFVDDNPFEQDLVKTVLPMVTVIDMPEDPSHYIRAVDSQALFETVALSEEDLVRGDMYKSNADRMSTQTKFENLDSYLEDLEMESQVGFFDQNNLPRISQLINKSNQFHLTTTRYNETTIKEFMQDTKKICVHFRLKDRFGDNGLISVVVMEGCPDGDLAIDTWVMSCRVLSRGMEEFISNTMSELAKTRGYKRILGKYIPTEKNKLVEKLYEKLGYDLIEERDGTTTWELRIDNNDSPLKTHIRPSVSIETDLKGESNAREQ